MSSNEALFTNEKLGFFNEAPKDGDIIPYAQKKSYPFLAKHHEAIQKRRTLTSKALEQAQLDDTAKAEQARFLAYCDALIDSYNKKRNASMPPEGLIHNMYGYIIFFHIYRIMTTFGILTTKMFLLLMHESQLLESFYALLGPGYNFDFTLDALNFPVPAMNILSFAILGLRLLIDSMNILRHVIDPTDAEKELSAFARFTHEAYKCRFNLINDCTWITLNALSNYPALFNISPGVANALLLAGLSFDLSLVIYRYYETGQAYHEAKEALEAEPESAIRKAELHILELEYIEARANFQFSMFAASTLISGFTLFLTATSAIMVPLAFLTCLFGTSLYLTADKYANYQKQSAIIQTLEEQGVDAQASSMLSAKHEQEQAVQDGISSILKHTFYPLIFVGTMALCWPAGFALVTLYGAHSIYQATAPKEEDQHPESTLEIKPA